MKNVYLAFNNSVYKKGIYTLNLGLGIDASFTDFNSFNHNYQYHIHDIISYNENRKYIDIFTHTRNLRVFSFGIDLSIDNYFSIYDNLSAFISLIGRSGLMQAFSLYHESYLTSIESGFSTYSTETHVVNKGDFLGIKIGVEYKLYSIK